MGAAMSDPCKDCGGLTIELRGRGLDTEYRLCPLWREPGHKTEDEVRKELSAARQSLNPGGRYA